MKSGLSIVGERRSSRHPPTTKALVLVHFQQVFRTCKTAAGAFWQVARALFVAANPHRPPQLLRRYASTSQAASGHVFQGAVARPAALCARALSSCLWRLAAQGSSVAARCEFTWLNHAVFGERTTGFWLQTRHMCDVSVSASGLALTIHGYTWLSVGLKLEACWRCCYCSGGVPHSSAASHARISIDRHASVVTRCHTSYFCVDTLLMSFPSWALSVPCFM